MTVFVTGATGFIGRHLVEALSREGRTVRCLVREPSRGGWIRDLPGTEIVQGSLGSEDVIAEGVRDCTTVFHLAGLTRAVASRVLVEVNGTATGRLAETVRRAAPSGCRLLYLSSLAAAGPCTSENAAAEDCAPSPVSPYGESKLLGEELTARQLGNTGYTIIRAPAVYGPWDRDVLFLFRLARRGIILRVRNAVREVSIIHVRDLVTALLLAAGHPAADGKIYHVSDGVPHSLDDIAAALRAAVGRGRPVRVPRFVLRLFAFAGDLQGLFTGRPAVLNTGKARESLQCGWVCDDRAIRKDLGFESRIDLAEGFRETAAWYRKQGWL